MMRHVDLCSGIGGFALGFEWAGLSKPVLFCDIEPWSRKILAKHWPDVPIAEDVKELANDPDGLIPDCDILTAGYPCQPFSVAGKQRGEEDDRHIWPEIFKIIQAKRPTWIVCENVVGHINLGLNKVLFDLESKANYRVQTFCIGAVSVNAPHRRQRIWIIAHSNCKSKPDGTKHEQRLERANNVGNSQHDGLSSSQVGGEYEENGRGASQGQKQTEQFEGASKRKSNVIMADTRCKYGGQGNATELDEEQKKWSPRTVYTESSGERQSYVADTDSKGLQGQRGQHKPISEQETGHTARNSGKKVRTGQGWEFEPDVGRVAHGIPRRMDRLRGLGNAIVPQIAQKIGETIKAVSL